MVLIAAPWGLRLWSDLRREQAELARATERADIAAHLHDSVLQTLALIQRKADDPTAVARLARAQERELRSWLYAESDRFRCHPRRCRGGGRARGRGRPRHPDRARGHRRPRPRRRRAGPRAAVRESLLNAVRHGAPPVSAYVEIGPSGVEAFVRDHGPGFDLDDIPEDRLGVRQSILGQDGAPRRVGQGSPARVRHRGGAGASPSRARHPCERHHVECHPQQRTPDRSGDLPPPPPCNPVTPGSTSSSSTTTGCSAPASAPRSARRSTSSARPPPWRAPSTVITATRPSVVLLDVHLPGGNGNGGVDVIRGCRGLETESGQPVRFLALSVSDAAEDVIAVIRAGARGYVTKTINANDLTNAIRRVADGDAVFSPRLAGFVLDAFGAAAGEIAEVDEELDRLSAREREVMRLIARGYQYKEVAKELFISVKTVETHVSSVLRKLQLSSRHELTAWAMGRRLL